MSWDLIKLAFECEGNLEGREDHILLYLAYKVNQNEAKCCLVLKIIFLEKVR